MLFVNNLPLIRLWVKMLEIPKELRYAGILIFGTLGVYSHSNSLTELLILYAVGIVGFFMRKYNFPVAPAILGAILGPLMETQFRRAIEISQGDVTVFVTRPLSLVILLLAAAVLLLPLSPDSRSISGANTTSVRSRGSL
jgi:putative tricarboxylic transport membrane protein